MIVWSICMGIDEDLVATPLPPSTVPLPSLYHPSLPSLCHPSTIPLPSLFTIPLRSLYYPSTIPLPTLYDPSAIPLPSLYHPYTPASNPPVLSVLSEPCVNRTTHITEYHVFIEPCAALQAKIPMSSNRNSARKYSDRLPAVLYHIMHFFSIKR